MFSRLIPRISGFRLSFPKLSTPRLPTFRRNKASSPQSFPLSSMMETDYSEGSSAESSNTSQGAKFKPLAAIRNLRRKQFVVREQSKRTNARMAEVAAKYERFTADLEASETNLHPLPSLFDADQRPLSLPTIQNASQSGPQSWPLPRLSPEPYRLPSPSARLLSKVSLDLVAARSPNPAERSSEPKATAATTTRESAGENLPPLSQEHAEVVARAGKMGVFSGDYEIRALSRILERNIRVYKQPTSSSGIYTLYGDYSPEHSGTINLGFNGNHFNKLTVLGTIANSTDIRGEEAKSLGLGDCLYHSVSDVINDEHLQIINSYRDSHRMDELRQVPFFMSWVKPDEDEVLKYLAPDEALYVKLRNNSVREWRSKVSLELRKPKYAAFFAS